MGVLTELDGRHHGPPGNRAHAAGVEEHEATVAEERIVLDGEAPPNDDD